MKPLGTGPPDLDFTRRGMHMHAFLLVRMLILAAAWLWFLSSLLRVLHERHGETFRALGRPTLGLSNTVSSSGRMVAWILAGRYSQLHDAEVERLGGTLRVLFLCYSGALVAAIALVVS